MPCRRIDEQYALVAHVEHRAGEPNLEEPDAIGQSLQDVVLGEVLVVEVLDLLAGLERVGGRFRHIGCVDCRGRFLDLLRDGRRGDGDAQRERRNRYSWQWSYIHPGNPPYVQKEIRFPFIYYSEFPVQNELRARK